MGNILTFFIEVRQSRDHRGYCKSVYFVILNEVKDLNPL